MTKHNAKRKAMIWTVGGANALTNILILKSDPLAKHVYTYLDEDRQSIGMYVLNSEPNGPNVLECKDKMINEI